MAKRDETLEIGIRQLRSELRRCLERVANGEQLIITERGRPVARLIGVDAVPVIDRLIAEGVIALPQRPRRASKYHRKVKARGTVSNFVRDQRR